MMGMNFSKTIVEGSVTNDLKGSLRDTGTTSYEFTNSFRSTCICLRYLYQPIKKVCVFIFNPVICDSDV